MDGIEARDEATLARSYLDRARDLQPMLRAAGAEIERHRQLPPHIVGALIERGGRRHSLQEMLRDAD